MTNSINSIPVSTCLITNIVCSLINKYQLTRHEIAAYLVERQEVKESEAEISAIIQSLINTGHLEELTINEESILKVSQPQTGLLTMKSRKDSLAWLNDNVTLKKLFSKAKSNYINIIKKAEAESVNHFNEALEFVDKSTRIKVGNKEYISFTTNDYLGLSNHPRVKDACIQAIKDCGNGTCGARVSGGTTSYHKELEDYIARFCGEDSAVLFNSGYVTNLAIADILSKEDAVICDRLNHASIVDGIRLSGAQIFRFKHNDIDSLNAQLKKARTAQNKLVFVESIYSMDGDIAPIPETIDVVRSHGAYLALDEAHSIGTIGKTGRGILEYYNLDNDVVDIRMSTLSKSAGAVGGFVTGKRLVCDVIRYNSRQYIFSASLPVSVVAGALEAFRIMSEFPCLTQNLIEKYTRFAARLREHGFNLGDSCTQIIPIIIGDEDKTCLAHNLLLDEGIYVTSVIYPVVPIAQARLRIGITLEHTEEELDRLFTALDLVNKRLKII